MAYTNSFSGELVLQENMYENAYIRSPDRDFAGYGPRAETNRGQVQVLNRHGDRSLVVDN